MQNKTLYNFYNAELHSCVDSKTQGAINKAPAAQRLFIPVRDCNVLSHKLVLI